MKLDLNTPQSRAIVAGLATGAGIEASDDPRMTVVMLVVFAVGGIVDLIAERRRRRRARKGDA